MAKATIDQIHDTVLDGWRLGCGCLHLQLAKESGGSSFVNVRTRRSVEATCPRYHGANR
jgi:hypothetical protein